MMLSMATAQPVSRRRSSRNSATPELTPHLPGYGSCVSGRRKQNFRAAVRREQGAVCAEVMKSTEHYGSQPGQCGEDCFEDQVVKFRSLLKRVHMSRKDRSQLRLNRAAAHLGTTLGTSHTLYLHASIHGYRRDRSRRQE